MRFKLFLFSLLFSSSYAVVTTYDTATAQAHATDTATTAATMTKYTSQVSTSMNKISSTYDSVEQLKTLQGLQKLNAAGDLCTLCTKSDQEKLIQYSNSINDDLCSQFSLSYQNITGMKKAANSLNDIVNLINNDPRSAALALQQAAIATQHTTNATLGQMQVMQAQIEQKKLAEEKIQQQNHHNLSEGIKDARF